MSWHDIVEVTCPTCGLRRNAELRERGRVRVCLGCRIRDARIKRKWASVGVLHNESKTPLYRVWNALKQRCDAVGSQSYKDYGGRGITYCSSWREFVPFRDWALAAGYRKGLVLDRENNDGNYEPGNCRWATTSQSGINRRTTRRKLADVAVMKDLLRLGVRVSVVAALYREEVRRICDLRDGKLWAWLDPLTCPLESK